MSKKKSPKKAVKNVIYTLENNGLAALLHSNLMADRIWNNLVEAGYIKARYAFYVGTGKIRNHFVD